MSYTHARLVTIALLGAVVCSFALAHVDDPKARDLLPPVYGQIYRAAEGGVAGEAFESSGVLLKSWFPLNAFPNSPSGSPTSGNDCWGYVSPQHREYAIMGLNNGTAFVEVTDPSNAKLVGHISGPNSLWRCVKTYGKYCYVGSEGGGGIQVIDLLNIDGPGGAGNPPRVNLVNTVTTGGAATTHTLFIDTASGFLYRAGGTGSTQYGLRMYSLANPANPVYVGQWSDVYVHEVQVVTYTSGPYAGRQIAFCCGGNNAGNSNTGVYIVDVTDKSNPTLMSYTTYPGARFCHQSWLSNDQKRIYINDEKDEGLTTSVTSTIVMNVENLSAPFVEHVFNNGNSAVGHNLYIRSGRLYEANYRSGLRVFDLAQDPINPPEVAYFDTWPGDDGPQYNGLWNVWPFFPSGTIIGSDINRGLFVWRLGVMPVTFAYPDGLPSLVDPNGQTVTVAVQPVPGQSPIPSNAVKLRVNVGETSTQITMPAIGGGLYQASLPAVPCGASLSYGFEVVISGDSFADPAGMHHATAATGVQVMLDDACEEVGGWSLQALGDTATSGRWINADPVGTGAQPEDDHTPEGTRCFVTGNGPVGGGLGDADVDGGITTLTSPVFDGSHPEARISYWRWYSNDTGAAPNADSMPVQISNDGGVTWVLLEEVTENANAWVQKTFRIADYVQPTAQVRLRFIARDLDAGSVVEAAVDDVRVYAYECTATLEGDLNRDGQVNGADLGLLLSAWGACTGCPADLNGDGQVNGADLGLLLSAWGG